MRFVQTGLRGLFGVGSLDLDYDVGDVERLRFLNGKSETVRILYHFLVYLVIARYGLLDRFVGVFSFSEGQHYPVCLSILLVNNGV